VFSLIAVARGAAAHIPAGIVTLTYYGSAFAECRTFGIGATFGYWFDLGKAIRVNAISVWANKTLLRGHCELSDMLKTQTNAQSHSEAKR
jgi:hypothetical protein